LAKRRNIQLNPEPTKSQLVSRSGAVSNDNRMTGAFQQANHTEYKAGWICRDSENRAGHQRISKAQTAPTGIARPVGQRAAHGVSRHDRRTDPRRDSRPSRQAQVNATKRFPLLRVGSVLNELPTTAKLLLIVTLALLPLGVIALMASLKAHRSSQAVQIAEMTVSANAAGAHMRRVLLADITAMRRAANGKDDPAIAADICTPLAGALALREHRMADYALYDAKGVIACRGTQATPLSPSIARPISTALRAAIGTEGLIVDVPSRQAASIGVLRYPPELIATIVNTILPDDRYTVSLTTASKALFVREDEPGPGDRAQSTRVPLGLSNAELTVVAFATPPGLQQRLLAFLPLLMWAGVSLVTLLVFDRLLLSPLRHLQHAVTAHQAGTHFRLSNGFGNPREIRALGEAITGYIDQLETKETTLATALENQQRATREVHHRVKNNIQVVASLISLHARAARNSDASVAYAAIQRRVDAMAIVHRNHYAEMSSAHGIDLKILLGEVATNLRASFPAPSQRIALAATPVRASQDHALAIAFLATELAELAMMVDPAATIRFEVGHKDDAGYFCVESSAFAASPALVEQLEHGYGRIVDGLVRQLRAKLGRDTQSFSVTFATIEMPTL
jgi:two-component system, sensor histidine kinase PdtaS